MTKPLTEGKMRGGNGAIKELPETRTSAGADKSWFSETTKTVIVTVTMSILIIGMGWGYYAANQWKQDRYDAEQGAKMEQQLEILLEPVREQLKNLEESDD